MSNLNGENAEPEKDRSENKVQPKSPEDAWSTPGDDQVGTMPIKKGRKTRSKATPILEETSNLLLPEPVTEPESKSAGTVTENLPTPDETIQPEPEGTLPPAGEIPVSGVHLQKIRRGKWIWLGILVMVVIIAVGAGIGYASAMKARQIEQNNQRLIVATTQFELGLVDQKAGKLKVAKQRFEYVLSIYPEYPGIDDKLVEIGLAIAQNQGGTVVTTPEVATTPGVVTTPVPTKETRSVTVLVNQARSQLAAMEWDALYTTLSSIRDINPDYDAIHVDGMLYLALRNRGISQIQAGNLEPGMYSFAMAKQIGPLDENAESYSTWARLYIDAGSNWAVNWYGAVEGFANLYPLVPQLRDASGITVTQRYARALIGYGDYLQQNSDYCGAAGSYTQAKAIYDDPSLPEKIQQAEDYCANPPEAPTPTVDLKAPTPKP